MMQSARSEKLVPVVVVIVVLLTAILSVTPWPVGAYEDDAIYTLLAKALASGEGYRMINLPGTPAATHYPPGYPFLLSLLWRVWPEFPDNVVVFKFANAVLLAAGAAGIYLFARRRLEYTATGAGVLAIAATAAMPMLQLTGLVLSEPLFLAIAFVVFLAIERTAATGSLRDAAATGVLLGILCLVRTIGVVAVAAALLLLVARRHVRAAIVAGLVAFVLVLPWQLWVSAHQAELQPVLQGKYGPYLSWVFDGYRTGGVEFARGVFIQNLAGMANTLSYLVMPANAFWPRLVSLVLLGLVLIAGLRLLSRRAPTLVLFCVLYLLLLVAWPFHPYRFLLALWPVLLILAVGTGVALWRWQPEGTSRRAFRFVALGGVACLAIGHAAYNWHEYQAEAWVDLQRRAGISARPLVEWVDRNTEPGDILATEHDVVVYLYTGRQGVPVSTFLPSQFLAPFTPVENAHWVGTIVQTFEPRYLITGFPAHVAAADTLATTPQPPLRRAGSIPNHVIFARISE